MDSVLRELLELYDRDAILAFLNDPNTRGESDLMISLVAYRAIAPSDVQPSTGASAEPATGLWILTPLGEWWRRLLSDDQ